MDVTQEIGSSRNNFHEEMVKFEQAIDESNLQTELTNKTGTKLHDLNEDCLLEIFSDESLTVMDLCSLTETCTRFQNIVRLVFPKIMEICIEDDNHYSVLSWKNSSRRGIKNLGDLDIETLLRNCGPTLCKVRIATRNYDMEDKCKTLFVLKLVSKYCVDDLESSDNCGKNDVLAEASTPTFRRLQTLHLFDFDNIVIGGFDSFADFDSLIELSIWNVKGYSSILGTIFPKLQTFTFTDGSVIDEFYLLSFLSRHPKLKTLYLRTEITEKYRTDFLREICNRCEELEDLFICFYCLADKCILQPLQSLKRLNTLELSCVSCEDWSFVPAMTNLRQLKSHYCFPPKDEFVHLTQITKLRFDEPENKVDVVDVIKQLINLEEFEIRDFTLNEKMFSKIVRIVKERSHVLTLRCDFDFSYDTRNRNENQKVRLVKFGWKFN